MHPFYLEELDFCQLSFGQRLDQLGFLSEIQVEQNTNHATRVGFKNKWGKYEFSIDLPGKGTFLTCSFKIKWTCIRFISKENYPKSLLKMRFVSKALTKPVDVLPLPTPGTISVEKDLVIRHTFPAFSALNFFIKLVSRNVEEVVVRLSKRRVMLDAT